MQRFTGKRIVVASGASGIGAATAVRLAREGARLIVGDINVAGVNATVDGIRRAGGSAVAVRFDLANAASVEALIDSCVTHYGGLDGLVNVGADLALARKEIEQDLLGMEVALWHRTFDVNTIGHALAIRAAIPHMIRAGGGAIAGVSSLSAMYGFDSHPAYAASKAALHALTRHVARRWGKQNIRCNGIAPGYVMTDAMKQTLDQASYDATVAALPLTRLGTPEDMAAALAFLLSEDAAWITGQIISVNGGAMFRD